jgi:tetratricopeptide (TPR) repeat protein
VIAIEKIPLDYRIANTFFSYIRYIGKTLWPSRLAVLYPHPHIYPAGAAAIIAGLLLVLLTIFCIDFGRRKKYLITGWFWYVGTLVPVIGLVQVGSQGIADRYMYLPMTGLILVATWGVNDIIAGRPRLKIITAISAGIILLLLLVLTQIQVQYWQNSLTLFEHTLRVTKDNAGAETYYGAALAEAGRFSQAEQHLKNALQINSEAAPAYYHLGMTLAMTGKFDEAVNCFRAVIELDQNYPSIYKRMGMTLLSASKPDEAVEYLRKSLQINPNEAIVYVTLSIAYIKSGEIDLAIETWARAKELEPGIAVGLNNPAWVLVTSGDISAKDANNAIVFAERNCKMTGYNDPGLLDTLAAAYAAAGRFDEALKTAQKAVDAAKKSGREDLADAIRKRMELYKAGHRYRR